MTLKIPKPLGTLKKYPKPVLKPDNVIWRKIAVFNPAIYIDKEGRFKLLYRAIGEHYRYISRIGVAISEDGINFTFMGNKPILYPERPEEWWGVEDPRVTFIDGKIIMTYTMWDRRTTLVGIAEIVDMGDKVVAKRKGIVKFPAYNKNAAFIKIGDKILLIHRPWYWGVRPSIWVSRVDTYKGIVKAVPSQSWILYDTPVNDIKAGMAAPPIRLDNGEWLFLYHVVHPPEYYTVHAALVDKEFNRIIADAPKPILVPSTIWELHGDVPFVVFPCGAIVIDDELRIYYGAGDKVVMMAYGSLSELVSILDKHRIE
ncbi:hypothetical protein J4526_08590 [Desulfurococcaceae archaeon MEX13E-LK6-19]|nr:hypothetical protein J4526_08590 [Desulfurococcaceae archaeon MEX13E-LK6-19]